MRGLRPALWVAVTLALATAPRWGLDPTRARQLVLIALLSLVVSGLNLSFGQAGELSFAQPVMYAVGAYVTAVIALHWTDELLIALAASMVAGLLLGAVTGIPGLRLDGWMLAISSLFLVLLIPDVVGGLREWTGGAQGLGGVPLPTVLGREVDQQSYVAVVVVVTSAWFAVFRNLVVSPFGRSLSVLRESPVLASSLGISVVAMKLRAYALSGVPAAMAGTLFAFLDGYVAPESFGVAAAVSILAASILGGPRSVYGIFVGVALMVVGPMQTTVVGDYAFVVYGIFLVVAGVALRQGITGLAAPLLARVRRRPAGPTAPAARAVRPDGPVGLPALPGARLAVSGVTKSFGGVTALREVSLHVDPGEVVALIGPNGSGKTTLLNVICGYYRVDAGTVAVGERDVTGLPPYRIARAGVARTFQTPLVPHLSVYDAVAAARSWRSRLSVPEVMLRVGRFARAGRRDRALVDRLLRAVGLSAVADEPAPSLPLGTRRLLELARSLAGEPSVLLLDEVASGLGEDEVAELSEVVRSVRDSGGAVVLVEHNFALVTALADRVVVLSRGGVVVTGTPEEVAAHPDVRREYLGIPVQPAGGAHA